MGYRVFVVLDDGNAGQFGDDEKEYLMKIMRQMAAYFKKEVIDVNPIYFCTSEIPVRPPSANKQENTKNIDKQSDSLLPSLEESETEPRIKKRKRNSTDVFFKILLGIFITVVLVALFFLIRFISHLGGILGFVVFILCAVAFIPEVLKGK